MHLKISNSESVEMPAGKCCILCKRRDSSAVEGDPFRLEESSAVKITLAAGVGGNYGIRASKPPVTIGEGVI